MPKATYTSTCFLTREIKEGHMHRFQKHVRMFKRSLRYINQKVQVMVTSTVRASL